MSNIVTRLEEVIGRGRIKQDEPLALHVVRHEGGNAEFFSEIAAANDLIKLIKKAKELGIPVFVFGTGSKISIPNEGVKGLVIKNSCHRFDKASLRGKIVENQLGVDEVLLFAEAGANMNQVVRYTLDEGLEGLEYQLGLPGTVGGALYTNEKFGPRNIYVRSHLYAIQILHEDGELHTYSKELPHFISFDDELYDMKEIIVSATFKLLPSDKKDLWEKGTKAVEYRTNGVWKNF